MPLITGRHQTHVIVRRLALLLIVGTVRHVALERGPHHERARGFVEGADAHQGAPHVRMHDDGIGGLVLGLRSRQGAPLQAILRVGDRVLIGDFRLSEALHADAEPRLIHHDEHRRHALVLFADQPADGVVEVQHAGRIAVDAHLVLDRAARHAVLCAERAIGR